MSGINIGNDTPFEVMSALVGGVDGKQNMGETQGADAAGGVNPLGALNNVMGMVGGLMKVAGPILGAIGI